MKISTLILIIALALNISVQAQNTDPNHKNFFKESGKIEGENYTVEFIDIVAKVDYAKMAAKVTNTSNDYLMFKTQEPEFIFEFGKFNSKEKIVFILSNSSEKETLKVMGDNRFHVDEFKLNFSGLYFLSAKGKVQEMEEFRLPASKNYIEAGNFKISLIKADQRTQETYGKFECEYIGDNIGIVDPSKISVRVDGKDIVYANDIKKAKKSFLQKGGPIFLRKGEKATFKAVFHIPGRIADMQFSLLYIMWGDTFIESEPVKLAEKEVEFVVDPGLTHGKN